MGRKEDALAAYQTAADFWDRPAAAQGQLREIALRYSLGDLKRDDVISHWKRSPRSGAATKPKSRRCRVLARLYTEQGRYRDSFYVMRSAMAAHPNSDMTRRIQHEAAATFDALFLSGKGDGMPAIDALALFYDFRELTPIGRRGDEMIRRLADRLVSVDLLDQAAELLQYQVDHRLQGAARAQVATRLAVIYLMNRKSDRALATLRATRTADLANEMRNQRLLLEARALSDLGRHDLALEVIANVDGREAIRLRSDILWAARRWAKRRNKSSFITATAGRTGSRLTKSSAPTSCGRRPAMRLARISWARALPRKIRGENGANARRPVVRDRIGCARHQRSGIRSIAHAAASVIRSTASCATCRRIIRTRVRFRRQRRQRPFHPPPHPTARRLRSTPNRGRLPPRMPCCTAGPRGGTLAQR